MANSNNEAIKENNPIELIKNKIADYLVENFKTRASNEKKQEIINMVSKISYQERNQIINYISDLWRNIREYENCDDQSQLAFLLKEFNLSDDEIRRTLKLDVCELGASIMNNTGPLSNKDNYSYEKIETNEVPLDFNIIWWTYPKDLLFSGITKIVDMWNGIKKITIKFSKHSNKVISFDSTKFVDIYYKREWNIARISCDWQTISFPINNWWEKVIDKRTPWITKIYNTNQTRRINVWRSVLDLQF